ncbi:MAG: cell division protein ZapA [Treponema sp.]|nr:cell division protein ZapA [Treponema sp.]
MVNELCLDILGTSFTITADEDEEYLKKVLAQYKAAVNNTQNISGISEPLNIAILTGFMLCDEINKMKQMQDNSQWEDQEVEERTIRLINKLEHALNLFGENK